MALFSRRRHEQVQLPIQLWQGVHDRILAPQRGPWLARLLGWPWQHSWRGFSAIATAAAAVAMVIVTAVHPQFELLRSLLHLKPDDNRLVSGALCRSMKERTRPSKASIAPSATTNAHSGRWRMTTMPPVPTSTPALRIATMRSSPHGTASRRGRASGASMMSMPACACSMRMHPTCTPSRQSPMVAEVNHRTVSVMAVLILGMNVPALAWASLAGISDHPEQHFPPAPRSGPPVGGAGRGPGSPAGADSAAGASSARAVAARAQLW